MSVQVAGAVHGGTLRDGHGSYHQLVRVDSENLFRIPEGLSFDEVQPTVSHIRPQLWVSITLSSYPSHIPQSTSSLYGADYVFPYNDPNRPAKIKKLANGKLYLGYDTISEKGTMQIR